MPGSRPVGQTIIRQRDGNNGTSFIHLPNWRHDNELCHQQRRRSDLLQRLGIRSTDCFSHAWPLSGDDWDTQMMFFLNHGYRVVAHDRRGHGRSSQTGDGHDMDHYADDLAAVTAHLQLKNAIHVGHSTAGGEVVHYLALHGQSNVAM